MMRHALALVLLAAAGCDAFTAPAALPLARAGTNSATSSARPSSRPSLTMQAEEAKPRRSWISRNVEDTPRSRKYFEIEERGEFLAGPDRAAEWGEELTEMGKWQRTKGPLYIQISGGALLLGGFINYFGLSNLGSASSALWCVGILIGLLGFALQRKA